MKKCVREVLPPYTFLPPNSNETGIGATTQGKDTGEKGTMGLVNFTFRSDGRRECASDLCDKAQSVTTSVMCRSVVFQIIHNNKKKIPD